MIKRLNNFFASLALLATIGLLQTAEAATPAEIDAAIDKSKAFLLSIQKNGNWEEAAQPNPNKEDGVDGVQWGGMTSLVTYALIAAGEDESHPKLAEAIAFLKKLEIRGVYAASSRAMLWASLKPSAANRDLLKRDAETVLRAMKSKGEARGMFSYIASNDLRYDHSVSQYGVLGAWAAAEAGLEIPGGFWRNADQAWRTHQNPDGGWGYIWKAEGKFGASVPTMTTAGLASLFVTQNYLARDYGINCATPPRDENMERAMTWLKNNFRLVLEKNPSGDNVQCYALYGVERIGVASGLKYFGNIDWYQAGADFLLKNMRPDGSIQMGFPVAVDTSLALLFLTRGRAPVAINKLEFDTLKGKDRVPALWNQRPRDAANLAYWASRQLEGHLNWQIVNFSASLRDLLDAPILYISTNQPLAFAEPDETKLKQYVEGGGVIVLNANCAAKALDVSARKLGTKLFPKYEFRELPADHPIFSNQMFSAAKWKSRPRVLGLSNGARELMLLIPDADASKSWQLYDTTRDVFQLGVNLINYCTERQRPRQRGQGWFVEPDPQAKTDRTLKMVRLEYNGNWNPEPGGWNRLSALLRNRDKLDLQVQPMKASDSNLAGLKFAHLTGTSGFQFNDAERTNLKKFIESGGTLLVDAAGGAGEFADAAAGEMDKIFGADAGQLAEIIPLDDALFSPNGKAIDVEYRSFSRKVVGQLKGPRLRGIKKDGRWIVLFSREDLSVALVGNAIDGIYGYTPATATAFVQGLITSLK